jgi:NADH-quinone oxidoreductase subunit E
MAYTIPGPLKHQIDEIVARYPEKQAALLPVLHLVHEHNGYHLTFEAMDAVAEVLGLPHSSVYEVATFYTMYNLKPVGRCRLQVCTTVSCALMGAYDVVAHLEKKLGIKLGETTPDKKFSLGEVECLASCGTAPMMMVNDDYVENLSPKMLDELIAKHSKG